MKLQQSILTLTSSLVLATLASAGDTPRFYVDASAPGGDGSSWLESFQFLQDGLAAARDYLQTGEGPVEVWVADGTYRPDQDAANPAGTNDRNARFEMALDVTVLGGFQGDEDSLFDRSLHDPAHASILTGEIGAPGPWDNSYNVVSNRDLGNPTGPYEHWPILNGFTVEAGNADGGSFLQQGGGYYAKGTHGIIANCVLRENQAYLQGGGLTLATGESSVIEVHNTRIEDNVAQEGGGIFALAGNLSLFQCEISGNRARPRGFVTSAGGGMLFITSSALLQQCTVVDNQASFGGAFWGHAGSVVDALNSIFHGNVATHGPSGQGYMKGLLTVRNCAVGAGLDDLEIDGGTLNVLGTLVENDPQFVEADAGDFRLNISSPCGDQADFNWIPNDLADVDQDGNVLEIVSRDLAGNPRLGGNAFDIGAYEAGHHVPSYCESLGNSVSDDGAKIRAEGSLSERDANLRFVADSTPNTFGLFVLGMERIQTPFGDGFLCVGGQKSRLAPVRASQRTMVYEVDWNAPAIRAELQVGQIRHVQAWYRDMAAGGAGFNTSDALTIEIMP